MNVYFVYPGEVDPGNWESAYLQGVQEAFRYHLTDMRLVLVPLGKYQNETAKDLCELPEKSVVLVWRAQWEFGPALRAMRPDLHLVGQAHSYPWQPFDPCSTHSLSVFTDFDQDRRLTRVYDRVLVGTDYQDLFSGELQTEVAGFPYPSDGFALPDVMREPEKVIFTQRLSHDKNLVLAVQLARMLCHAGLRPVFVTNWANDRWRMADVLQWGINEGLEVRTATSKKDYFDELASSGAWVTTSMADNTPVNLKEALLCGCSTLAPDIPPYNLILNRPSLYRPYDLDQIVSLCQKRPGSRLVRDVYSVAQWAKALRRAIK